MGKDENEVNVAIERNSLMREKVKKNVRNVSLLIFTSQMVVKGLNAEKKSLCDTAESQKKDGRKKVKELDEKGNKCIVTDKLFRGREGTKERKKKFEMRHFCKVYTK